MTSRDPKREEPSPDDANVSVKLEKQLDYFCPVGRREDDKKGVGASLNAESEPNKTDNGTEDKATPEIRTNKDETQETSDSCPGSSSSFKALKKCHNEGCGETTERSKVKTWLCKRHRNKLYKDTYKKKKNELPGGMVGEMLLDNLAESSGDTDAPVRQCSMLEQVLNEKKITLLQSPEVQEFFRQQQQELRSSHHMDTN
ncbi:RFXAP [Branchiostoma lanceolatum]|uniref:RFXAP protein n=1 Tax=Branchiostoma lanceolatum TaxID=7740 RepID=A0A8K0A3D5_BRALA|nr:RFXAP [Branchiostoma lanceolatum]